MNDHDGHHRGQGRNIRWLCHALARLVGRDKPPRADDNQCDQRRGLKVLANASTLRYGVPMSKFTLPHITLPHISVPQISVPKISVPKVSVPKVSVPKVRLPQLHSIDLTSVDLSRLSPSAVRENPAVKQATELGYTAVGFAVLGFQKAQVRRRELLETLTSAANSIKPK